MSESGIIWDDFIPVNFAPTEMTDLIAPSTGENEQSKCLGEMLRNKLAGIPHRHQFIVGEKSVSLGLSSRLREVGKRIGFYDPSPNRPLEQPVKMALRSTGHNGRPAIHNRIDYVENVSPESF